MDSIVELELDNKFDNSAEPVRQNYHLTIRAPEKHALDDVDRAFVEHLGTAAPRMARRLAAGVFGGARMGAVDLWVTEFVLTYDGLPSYSVSIMEFRDGKVARETQYFGDPFEPGASRAQWVEPIG